MDKEKETTVPAAKEAQNPQTEPALTEGSDRKEPPVGQTPPGDPEPSALAGRPKRQKKRAILFLGVLLGLMVLLILLNTVDFAALSEKWGQNSSDPVPTSPVQIYPEEWFEPADYNGDITADPEYMALDRRLCYEESGLKSYVSQNPEAHGTICAFWYDYMNALMEGDAGKLNSMHVDDFVERMRKQGEFVDGYEKGFAPQKIYDFTVSLLRVEDLQNTGDANGNYRGYIVYYFDVSYRIKDNNGTFRRDFYDDEHEYAVPLRFEVLEHGDEIQINSYKRIRTLIGVKNGKEGVNFMMYIWIALILLAIIAELLTTSLVAVWFIPAGIASLILSIFLREQIVLQIVVYVAASALLLLLTRPLIRRRLQKGDYQPTNADMAVGKTAVVTERIDNIAQTGEVSVDGKRWSARSADGSVIEPEQLVSVLEIRGVKLICARSTENAKIEK